MACHLVTFSFSITKKRWPSDKPIILWEMLASKNSISSYCSLFWRKKYGCLFLINLILIHLYCYCYINLGHYLISVLLVAVLLGHATFLQRLICTHVCTWLQTAASTKWLNLKKIWPLPDITPFSCIQNRSNWCFWLGLTFLHQGCFCIALIYWINPHKPTIVAAFIIMNIYHCFCYYNSTIAQT